MAESPTVIQKYGGSSLADAQALARVAQQIVARARGGVRLVVVVSAMGETTDALVRQAHGINTSPPMRELDMLVTAGERISMALLSMAVEQAGGLARSLTGSQSGIITENTHQGARIIAVRPHRIHKLLDDGFIVIVAGYQGVSLEGEVTTLGRGGSDTTAVALGAALGAVSVDIFSDVDGVYSADPRICPQAKLLPRISCTFMSEMAHFGAQVLHHQAVSFAERAGIALHARSASRPDGPSTVIQNTLVMPPSTLAISVAPRGLWLRAPSLDAMGLLLRHAAMDGLRLMVLGGMDALLATEVPLDHNHSMLLQASNSVQGLVTQVAAVTLTQQQSPDAHQLLEVFDICRSHRINVLCTWSASRSITVAVAPPSAFEAARVLHALVPSQ